MAFGGSGREVRQSENLLRLNYYLGAQDKEIITEWSPRQYQIKCYELKQFLIEDGMNRYLGDGWNIHDLPQNHSYVKKFEELQGYKTEEELIAEDDGIADKNLQETYEKMFKK